MQVSETTLLRVKTSAATSLRRIAGALLTLAPVVAAQQPVAPPIVLVESVPAGTELGHAGWPRTADVWLDLIGGARDTLDLAHFYASDEPGSRLEEVVRAIEAAADRGVRVRFLADAGFYKTYPETLDRLAAREHVELRKLDLKSSLGGVQHAKYMIADRRDLFLGSPNFDWRSLEHIQELGARVRIEPVAQALEQVFEADWARAGGAEVPPDAIDASQFPVEVQVDGGSVRVTPVFSPRPLLASEELWDLAHIVRAIDAAKQHVYVQVLTYKTTDADKVYFDRLETALRSAAARGVDVRLIVADWSKRKWTIEGLQSLEALPGISVRMIAVPQLDGGFIPYARVAHAKYMVVDGRTSWVGTGNWSRDYFEASRNVGLMIEGEVVAKQLEGFFLANWDGKYAEEVDPCGMYEAPRIGE